MVERERLPQPSKTDSKASSGQGSYRLSKNGDVLSMRFSIAFSRLSLPHPGKEEHSKDKGLCPTFESTQETRHRGDVDSSGSRKLKQDVTKRAVCPTQESLEKLTKIISFPIYRSSPGMNYILNLQDKMIPPNYRTWGHVND